MMRINWLTLVILMTLTCVPAMAKDSLRILTWDGYVTPMDVSTVNDILSQSGYDIEASVITPFAEGADQMYNLLRGGKADISFLTLFFIKMQEGKLSKLLQPINVNSPRLSNYKYLIPDLTKIPMGMSGNQPLYIPFSGGSYGFYINRKVVSAAEVPKSWADLFSARWKGKYSLNRSQIWYNVAIASIALGKSPYYVNSLAVNGARSQLIKETEKGSPLDDKLTTLYKNAGEFWDSATSFSPALEIVSSWGMEISQANKIGGNWQAIQFKEGDLVWMDTINFVSSLKGKRLEAAEIVANYFIGKEAQSRVASELSLVSVSTLTKTNPILKGNPKFFEAGAFVPPYDTVADNRMTTMSDAALKRVSPNK